MTEWERHAGFDLSSKKALVIGFSNPAGAAIATSLAEAGAHVATASSTLDGDEVMNAKRASKAIKALGKQTFSQGWDVTLPVNIQVGLRQICKEFGCPDILIYNADFALTKPLLKTTDTEFSKVHQINLHGAFATARSYVWELKENSGKIIFVSNIFGSRGLSNMAAYSSAKAGISGLTASLSQELAPQVNVNCIASGWMDWTQGRGINSVEDNLLLRFIPSRRFGEASELSALAVLLSSEAANYITGQTFTIDGGVSTHL